MSAKAVRISLLLALLPTSARAAELTFLCSWDQKAPITITIDTDAMTGRRDDGGRNYRVIKWSKFAAWLIVDDPENWVGAAIHMITRSEDPKAGGKWIDTVISSTGTVSSIDGGVCWER